MFLKLKFVNVITQKQQATGILWTTETSLESTQTSTLEISATMVYG